MLITQPSQIWVAPNSFSEEGGRFEGHGVLWDLEWKDTTEVHPGQSDKSEFQGSLGTKYNWAAIVNELQGGNISLSIKTNHV